MSTDNPYEFWGAAPEETVSSTTGIFVYIESDQNKLTDESMIAIGKARELGNMLGSGVAAVLMNSEREDLAKTCYKAGADKVYLANNNRFASYDTELYTAQLTQLLNEHKPEIFLSGYSIQTVDFFPRVAQRLKTGLISGCIAFEIDTMDRILLATRPAYKGKLHEIYVCKTARPQMVLLMPSIFPMPIIDDLRTGLIEKI